VITAFYGELASQVARPGAGARLYLNGYRALSGSGDDVSGVTSLVHSGGSPSLALREAGLDFARLASDPRIVVMRPHLAVFAADRAGQGALATLNGSPAVDQAFGAAGRGSLWVDLPLSGRIQEFKALGNTPGASTFLVATAKEPPQQRHRRARTLAALDSQVLFEGGAMIPLLPDDQHHSGDAEIASLPAVPFSSAGSHQPVEIRLAHLAGATWLCAANPSALAAQVRLDLSCPPTTRVWRAGAGRRPLALSTAPHGGGRLDFDLAAGDFWCVQIASPGVAIRESRVQPSGADLDGMRERVEHFTARLSTVREQSQRTAGALTNPGFEEAADPGRNLPGWEFPVKTAADWQLDEVNPRSGRSALQLGAADGHSALVSPPLDLAAVRYLSVSLWMRSNRTSARVQLALDTLALGTPRRQQAEVEVGKSWRRYDFRVDRLPLETPDEARFRVEPRERCQLWIDDVDLHLHTLSPDELRQLTKTLSSVKLAFEEKRYADCQRLLDGYWGVLLLTEPETAPAPSAVRPRFGERLRGLLRR
jgi:hypothetical protein